MIVALGLAIGIPIAWALMGRWVVGAVRRSLPVGPWSGVLPERFSRGLTSPQRFLLWKAGCTFNQADRSASKAHSSVYPIAYFSRCWCRRFMA